MFDVGFTEILLIGVVSLVVIGPERLPEVARKAGRLINKLQRFVRGVKSDLAADLQAGELKELLGDQRKQINELRQIVNSTQRELEQGTQEIVSETKQSLKSLESSIDQSIDEVQENNQALSDRVAAAEAEAEADQDSGVRIPAAREVADASPASDTRENTTSSAAELSPGDAGSSTDDLEGIDNRAAFSRTPAAGGDGNTPGAADPGEFPANQGAEESAASADAGRGR